MIEFTGERYIPGQGGAQIAYEHIHRYLFAMRWARGKRVLDVATGAGYGAALLATVARHVWAVEIDPAAIAGARKGCPGNVACIRGDATCLPLGTGSVDLAVAMEILEHVSRPESLVAEVARVLRPDGLAVISTPNRAAYSDARNYRNPFHVREFYRDEFTALLERSFPNVRLLRQQIRSGSLIDCESGRADGEIITDPLPVEGTAVSEPMYFLALCSHSELAECVPAASAYLDRSDLLEREWREELARLNAEIEALGRWGHKLESEGEELSGTIRELQREMETEIHKRDSALEDLQKDFDERTEWALDLDKQVKFRDERLKEANVLLGERDRDLTRIRHALLYRILRRLHLLPR